LLPGISSLVAAANELVKAAAQNDSPVFITGEVGTEKSFAAKLIHQLGKRAQRPLSKINVSWKLPPDLRQYIEQSTGGTIVFNLQKEFPVDMQYTLVELAQHGSYVDAHSAEVIDSDVRLVMVTSLNLDEIGRKGLLLPELRELLVSQSISVPPLRSRPEDIPALVRYATTRARDTGRSIATGADAQVLYLFRQWGWPGNAEDLLLVTAQAAITTKSDLIAIHDLPEAFLKQLPTELIDAARAVRLPRPSRIPSTRKSSEEVALPTFTPPAVKPAPDPHDINIPTPPMGNEIQTPVPVAAPPAARPVLPPVASEEPTRSIESVEVVPPRVLQLARRLNAQSLLLTKQMNGPLGAAGMSEAAHQLSEEQSDASALEALERQLDRGLDMVMGIRRQMALLNIRQQQSNESIKDLLQRVTHRAGETSALNEEERRDLESNLRAVDAIVNKLTQEIPQLGNHIEATMSGNATEPRITPSGIFRKLSALADSLGDPDSTPIPPPVRPSETK
jgi:hypothetical protein